MRSACRHRWPGVVLVSWVTSLPSPCRAPRPPRAVHPQVARRPSTSPCYRTPAPAGPRRRCSRNPIARHVQQLGGGSASGSATELPPRLLSHLVIWLAGPARMIVTKAPCSACDIDILSADASYSVLRKNTSTEGPPSPGPGDHQGPAPGRVHRTTDLARRRPSAAGDLIQRHHAAGPRRSARPVPVVRPLPRRPGRTRSRLPGRRTAPRAGQHRYRRRRRHHGPGHTAWLQPRVLVQGLPGRGRTQRERQQPRCD
jgi:hypothetical protein